MYLPIILAMLLYPVLAFFFVRFVWKRSSRKQFRWLAVALAILLPSWDAVLSAVVFYAACPFFSKAEVYETAETDGIYYEGYHRDKVFIRRSWDGSEVNRVLLADRDIQKGYQYMESLVTLRKSYEDKEMPVSPPVVYRCIEGPKDESDHGRSLLNARQWRKSGAGMSSNQEVLKVCSHRDGLHEDLSTAQQGD